MGKNCFAETMVTKVTVNEQLKQYFIKSTYPQAPGAICKKPAGVKARMCILLLFIVKTLCPANYKYSKARGAVPLILVYFLLKCPSLSPIKRCL